MEELSGLKALDKLYQITLGQGYRKFIVRRVIFLHYIDYYKFCSERGVVFFESPLIINGAKYSGSTTGIVILSEYYKTVEAAVESKQAELVKLARESRSAVMERACFVEKDIQENVNKIERLKDKLKTNIIKGDKYAI